MIEEETKKNKEQALKEAVDLLASIFVELIDSREDIKSNKKIKNHDNT